ncbi:Uncharacterized protein HZ326_10276 [Fusarium oxysporum f. sp. albedinis]|nr:Uncharacterized protein HZ326_10276 [Fusarium oxysporum f. sp. albedinis]
MSARVSGCFRQPWAPSRPLLAGAPRSMGELVYLHMAPKHSNTFNVNKQTIHYNNLNSMICLRLHRHFYRLSYQNPPFSSPELSLKPYHHPLLSQGPISSPSAETSTYGNCNEKSTLAFYYIRLSCLSEFPGGALRPTLGITGRRPVFPDSSTSAMSQAVGFAPRSPSSYMRIVRRNFPIGVIHRPVQPVRLNTEVNPAAGLSLLLLIRRLLSHFEFSLIHTLLFVPRFHLPVLSLFNFVYQT